MKATLLIIALATSTVAQATIHNITQQGTTFSPSTLQVTVGDTVRWLWTGGSHTTTSKVIPITAQAWDSPLSSSVIKFDYKVTVAGTYNYVCTPHESMGMTGQFTASVASAIDDNNAPSGVSIYPLPAQSELTVQMKNGFSANELFISDMLGRTILRRPIDTNIQNDLITLDISTLHPGIFFIGFISNNKQSLVLRFLKQ